MPRGTGKASLGTRLSTGLTGQARQAIHLPLLSSGFNCGFLSRQGLLQLPGINVRVTMHYSAPRVGRDARDAANRNDWMCKVKLQHLKFLSLSFCL